MKYKKVISFLISVVLCTLSIIACIIPAVAETNNNDSRVLTVGVPTDRCPIFYVDSETQEIAGIGVDLMELAADEAGYEVKFVQISEPSVKDALDSDAYDILMPFGSTIESTKGRSSVVSENLFQTPFTLVTEGTRDIPPFGSLRVGMLDSQKGVADTIRSMYPGIIIITYKDMDKCVKALRNKEVDALLHNSFVWSYILQKPAYSDLVVQPSSMFTMDFKVGTADTPEGRALISNLNKGIEKISDTKRQAITLDYTSKRLYKYDISDFFYSYWLIVLLAVLLFIAVVIIAVQRMYVVRKENEEKIQDLITHDPLTGVLSMDGFRQRAEELIRANPTLPYFLSYNNIRDFKFINDRLGRVAGDDLLKFWAAKSVEYLDEEEAIGRITADRFAVLRKIESDEEILADEKNVIEPVRNFFINQGKGINVQICSGIYVLTPEDFIEADIDHMLDLARITEKRVRQNRENSFAFCNPEQWEKGKKAADIISNLPSAIENEEIQVWYQPQVNYNTGEIIGAEALCRWNHGKLGQLRPSEIIPILENCGLIFDLDKYVWNKVCQNLKKWNEQGLHRTVSVNVSRVDIREDRDLVEHFNNLIQTYNLSPDQLRIEITESAYVENPELLISTAQALRLNGFKVEMDDFGSGYSSLHMLKEVPVDRIKLDFHFLTASGDSEKSKTIVSCMIKMINSLGIDLIAEGVETVEQAQFLKSEGAFEMQGYYFYKPMTREEFEKLI